ncbi:14-3-3-like protein 1 [Halichondria panicea]|uniref:14-3-3-like protein 1 n=1 Tax=Halichondria panicea TaxID=6063 RepID=UPI00312B2BF4
MADVLAEKAKLAEQAERYEDMAKFMKELAEKKREFNTEERNLLSVAYKNVVGAKRTAWRVLSAIERKEENSTEKTDLIKEYRQKIEKELEDICDEVVSLLETCLIVGDQETDEVAVIENKVFYLKMKADYYRYLSEIRTPNVTEHIKKSEQAYKDAQTAAEKLKPTHPIRLGLALNFSVFYYEIQDEPDKATALAKKAFDEAISEMDSLEDSSYKDSTLIMQLLRDNLALWNSSGNDEDEEQ